MIFLGVLYSRKNAHKSGAPRKPYPRVYIYLGRNDDAAGGSKYFYRNTSGKVRFHILCQSGGGDGGGG